VAKNRPITRKKWNFHDAHLLERHYYQAYVFLLCCDIC